MSQDLFATAGMPTLDRPFGVELWPIFVKAYSAVMGYSPTDFKFIPGVTPISTLKETAVALVTYYVVVFGGRELMRGREPFKLKGAFIIHNIYLTLISAGLLALFIEQLLPTLWNHGFFFSICNHKGGWTKELVVLYYLNYLTKYLELIDTVFLVLKKKPLTFLHTYHHGATALLCFSQLIGLTAVSWVPITLNLAVHVMMYSYYGCAAAGIRVPWKKQITMFQITQFVLDLGVVYFATYTYYASTYQPSLPNMGNCAGEEFAAASGCGILSSYLVLFILFYISTYKKTAGRPRRNTGKQALIAMAREEVRPVGETPKQDVKSNGSATNGHANGNANGMTTRSRKA